MTIDPELKPFIAAYEAAWPQSPLTLPVETWRSRAEERAAATRPPLPAGMVSSDHQVPHDGRHVRVRVYQPEQQEPLPIVVFMHGGGWVIGSVDGHDAITAMLAQ